MMKGYVELSKENGTALCNQCLKAMNEYEYKYETVTKSVCFGLQEKTYRSCINTPHWYGYEKSITSKLQSLMSMLDRGDPVHLSLDCYNELIKLSEGDRRANSIFIL